MSKLLITVVIVVATSAVLTISITLHSRQQLAALSQQFDSQAAQLSQFTAENSQLSNRVTSIAPQTSLTGHDLVELLQLRNEATRLREFAASKARLESANAKLRDQSVKSQ
jgi:hypothetical protein